LQYHNKPEEVSFHALSISWLHPYQ
jgi:hypothetical protein